MTLGAPALLAPVGDPQRQADHHDRPEVDAQVHEHVTGVGEDDGGAHASVADSSHSPRDVNPIITSSIHHCERVASRTSA